MIQTQPLTIDDFSGGFTDSYLDADLNKYEKADNFILNIHGKQAKLVTRPGSAIYDSTSYQIPAGNQRIGTLINRDNDSQLLIQSAKKIYYINSGWQTLTGPSGNDVFSTGSTTSSVSHAQWNKHLLVANDQFCKPQKIYLDGSSTLRLRTAGMPKLASSPTITAGAVGSNSYLYRFLYFYTYTVETVVHEDFGATTEVSLSSAAAPNSNAVSISNIPALSNGATDNYDTANIKVKIYRTTNNGNTFYYVGEVVNGITTFNDSMSDTTLQDSVLLYTEGGVVENDPPPPCKYLHITQSTAYYAHIKEGSEVLSNRVRQSIASDIDSSPEDFYVDIDEEITGISSVQGTPVIFSKNSVYRLDGTFDELGRGGMTYQKISDTTGCVSHSSIVQTIEGVFFAGSDGIYFCDAYKVSKVTEEWNDSYKELVSTETRKKNITGVYDEKNKRIWWAVQLNADSLDNDICLILDLRFGIRPSATFTTASGGSSFAPTALTIFNGDLIRADKRGYVFRHHEDYDTDPKVNILAVPSLWATQAIVFLYKGPSTNFGSLYVRKWVPRIELIAKNRTNVSIQISSNNDDNRQIRDLTPIRFRGNLIWGDESVIWGDETIVWNFDGLIDQMRRFPATSLRCTYKQIVITNAYVIITKSDTIGTATLNPVNKTVTLDTAASADWPAQAVGYFISFENDDYTREFEITARTNDTLTFLDPLNLGPPTAGSYKWVLRGIPKGEVLHLLSYTVHYGLMSRSQTHFKGETGANA